MLGSEPPRAAFFSSVRRWKFNVRCSRFQGLEAQTIDPHGNRVAQLPILQDGILKTALFLHRDTTFFTRAGWLFPWLICALALAATAFSVRKTRRTTKSKEPQPV